MPWASGKYSNAICDRCGFKFKYLSMLVERGTKLKVCSECYDGMWDRALHPQNHPPLKLTDWVGIQNPRPDQTDEDFYINYGDGRIKLTDFELGKLLWRE